MAEYKKLEIEDADEVTVVRLRQPRIADFQEIEEFGRELFRLVEEENRTKLVLDFSAVTYLSSAAFGKLIVLNGKVRAKEGVMKLCNIQPQVMEIFHICKLDSIFDIRQDEGDALPTI